jgi:hypothetical protein
MDLMIDELERLSGVGAEPVSCQAFGSYTA